MASIDSAERAGADQAQIWGSQEECGCGGKITKHRLLAIVALVGVAALGLGLLVGLPKSSSGADESSDQIVGQALDPSADGCYSDERYNRVMTAVYRDEALTPTMCNNHCEKGGYAYYGLQWGKECWCGAEGLVLNRNGDGKCDYPCAGDPRMICGGYLSFTAYKVGVQATASVSTCDGAVATVRLATSSGTAYFEGGGCATLTDMYERYPDSNGPLQVLDADDNIIVGGTPTGYWLLTMDLTVVDGVTLSVHGTSIGGDCDVLRIESTSDSFHELRAHGGSLSFMSTKVTSWDTNKGEERTTYEGGRSFINCVSEVIPEENPDSCEGAAKNNMGECRMDIIGSTMGNLGWFDAESYGLTWKVRGFCKDLSNPEVFERTNVYGDIKNSDIYGMYYGMYSYGHDGGVWINNKMHDNILYGFDPHDDSDDLTIAYNDVYGNGNHGIIASKRCNNVEIYSNEVYKGGEKAAGIFLHRSSNDAKVYNNTVHDMQDAGIAIMESMNADIYDNTITNVKYGIRISLGGAGNEIHDNIFDTCSAYGFYTYEGSDEPDASNGRPSDNVFSKNKVLNTANGVKLNEGDKNVFTGNEFTGTKLLEFKDSTDITWTGNSIGDACAEGDVKLADGSDTIPSC